MKILKSASLSAYPLTLLLTLASCEEIASQNKKEDADKSKPNQTTTSTTSTTTTTTTTTTTIPTTTTTIPTTTIPTIANYPTVGSYAKIASNFNVNDWMVGTIGVNVPPSSAPDIVGAFRFLCMPSHNAYDDPIVYPGKPGASHLHTFFGNTLTNANSTYESLRASGEGTCHGGPINRSAYWIPSVLTAANKVVMPNYVVIYYKALPKLELQTRLPKVETIPLPRGLRMVFGFNFKDPTKSTTAYWNCTGPGAVPGHYKNISEVIAAGCPAGALIGAVTASPNCWDGVNLDSPDHRSHLSFGSYGSIGIYTCPATHPKRIPQFTIAAWYTHEGPADLAGWKLSSDHMGPAGTMPGATFHSDWFGAWDDDIMDTWHDHALGNMLNTSEGGLGDGRHFKRPFNFSFGPPSPRLVDPPVNPLGANHMLAH